MKRTINLLSIYSLLVVGAFAASPSPSPKQAWFRWLPNPADLGGMTTNQYYTNIVFHLYSVTDCTTPTNSWPEVTNWLASTLPTVDGNWTNYVTIDGATRFYLLSVGGVGAAQSPFSNQAVLVATPGPGTILRIGP